MEARIPVYGTGPSVNQLAVSIAAPGSLIVEGRLQSIGLTVASMLTLALCIDLKQPKAYLKSTFAYIPACST